MVQQRLRIEKASILWMIPSPIHILSPARHRELIQRVAENPIVRNDIIDNGSICLCNVIVSRAVGAVLYLIRENVTINMILLYTKAHHSYQIKQGTSMTRASHYNIFKGWHKLHYLGKDLEFFYFVARHHFSSDKPQNLRIYLHL